MAASDAFASPSHAAFSDRAVEINETFARSIIPRIAPSEDEVRCALEILGMTKDRLVCAYCGDPAQTWQPLNAVVEDGRPTGYYLEIRNLVPTCPACDRAKGDQPWRAWIRSDAPDSPKSRGIADLDAKIAALEKYEEHFPPRTFSMEKASSPETWQKYWDSRDAINRLLASGQEMAETLLARLQKQVERDIAEQQIDVERDRQISLNIDAVADMARYYRDYFAQPGNDLDFDHFEERWSSVGFKMDYGASFVEKYTWDAFLKLDKLKEIIGGIGDVQLLGDAIFSEWRYITHVSNSHNEDEIEWILIALDRLIKIAF